jgi:hypothetical protein
MERDEVIRYAKGIVAHGDTITYPSGASARWIRSIMSQLIVLIEQERNMSLRERCYKILVQLQYGDAPAPNTQGTSGFNECSAPVDDLMAFVIAETGRAAEHRLDDKLPLCLYFEDQESREEFIAAWHEAKPNSVMRKVP